MVALGYYWPDANTFSWRNYEWRDLDRVVFGRAPQTQPLVAGQSASFTVIAAGYGALTYRWQHNGQNLTDGPAAGGGTISGATTPTLTINPVGSADGGLYGCVVTNACGSAVSATALLGTPVPADFDMDGDVDLDDLAAFQACVSGPGVAYTGDCAKADLDHNGDVDQNDFGLLQRCYSGAGIPASLNCAN